VTVDTIRARARQILEDTVAPYRWEDDQLRDHLQTAVRRLNRRVPSTRYVGLAVQDYIPLPVEDDADIPVDECYAGALALYVAYLAYFNDATDTVNNERAASCLARAEALMI
jgi:hypothetical protein